MAKRRTYHRATSMTIPLAPLAGLGVGIAGPVSQLLSGHYEEAAKSFGYRYTPFNPYTGKLDFTGMSKGLLPLVAGLAVHKFVGGKMGFNRMLAQAGVPLLRL